MDSLSLVFKIHHPFYLRTYRFFDIGERHNYYDDYRNKYILKRFSERSYYQANALMMKLFAKYGDGFRISFAFSGNAIDQMQWYMPELLEDFKQVVACPNVELLATDYSASAGSVLNKELWKRQVENHNRRLQEVFGRQAKVLAGTQLLYDDGIGKAAAEIGMAGMLTEGAKHVLGWKSPNYVYSGAIAPKLKLLLRNYTLSDDIAFRFSDKNWQDWPLTGDKFLGWIKSAAHNDEIVNLFMDYETFGEHQKAQSGIFDFMRYFPEVVIKDGEFEFVTPEQAGRKHKAVASLDVPDPISWADEERDITAWLGNELQSDAFQKLYDVTEKLSLISENDPLWDDFGHLQESDHFYYMCTKFFSDGAVHKYFNPYDTPYEAFINYMNVLSDFILRVDDANSVSDVKFAAGKKSAPAKAKSATTEKKAVRKVAEKKSAKTASETAAKKPSAKKTVKTKK